MSLARLECVWAAAKPLSSGALPLAAPAPLKIELRLLDLQNRRGELRISLLVVLTCSHFRRAPLTKNLSAPKGALPRAAEEKN